MKRTFAILLFALVFLALTARPGAAQEVDGSTWIEYDNSTGDILASCWTYADYNIESYYSAHVYCRVTNIDTSDVPAEGSANDDGYGSAEVDFEFAADLDTNYLVEADAEVRAYYTASELNMGGSGYFDPYDYLYFTSNPTYTPAPATWFPPGAPSINGQRNFSLGTMYDADKTATPHHLLVFEDPGIQTRTGCPSPTTGTIRKITYEIVDANGDRVGGIHFSRNNLQATRTILVMLPVLNSP